MLACKEYPHIPWNPGDITRVDSLWLSTFDATALSRVNMNLMNCTVNQWRNTPLRAPMIGSLWLPSVCTLGGLKLELGDEILSDWLEPPHNHGHPFSTLRTIYNAKKESDRLHRPADPHDRKSYSVLGVGGYWRIVVKDGDPPCIITFFKEG